MRRNGVAGAVGILILVAGLALPAIGATFELTIPLKVVRAPEGSVVQLEAVVVAEDLQGSTCEAAITANNHASVHPDNDIILTSGGSSVVLEDVESAPGATITGSGTLTLGETIEVSVRLGPDGVFSARGGLTLTCDEVAATTTTSTTTTIPESTTTTTAPEPTTTVADTTTTSDEVLPTVITTSTTAAPTSTAEDEVLDEEVLPFTGGDDDMLALLAGGLGVLGALVLASTRRMEDS